MTSDPITEQDLAYYVDDQLGAARRVEVEAYLAKTPEKAAGVMEDLRSTHELKLAMTDSAITAQPLTTKRARRLEGALLRRLFLHRLRPVFVVTFLVGAGALVGNLAAQRPHDGEMNYYMEAALQAHSISQLRAVMVSQPEAPEYDREELLSATAIVMPELPEQWDVTDVQVYPSCFGPSVEMAIDSADLGKVSLFAARPGYFSVLPPTVEQHGQSTLGHWQVGEIAYVLVSSSDEKTVRTIASTLFDTLY
ncbi:anti-sigma factor [Devosia sp.]|uniref:anti-sigma factor family protein n=1 Tax=Devosia sp. TaxID=1871048 RepID=UPI001AC09D6C|nr:anti-sigma factor [Devosia sp.]MBN9334453.1 anti-sigma factor [Devosia sp.]